MHRYEVEAPGSLIADEQTGDLEASLQVRANEVGLAHDAHTSASTQCHDLAAGF